MNESNEKQGNRLQNWGPRFLLAALLTGVGYNSPIAWLSLSAFICAGYLISFVTLPLLVAASQNTRLAKGASLTLSVLGTCATAAAISAPIVALLWYRATYLIRH